MLKYILLHKCMHINFFISDSISVNSSSDKVVRAPAILVRYCCKFLFSSFLFHFVIYFRLSVTDYVHWLTCHPFVGSLQIILFLSICFICQTTKAFHILNSKPALEPSILTLSAPVHQQYQHVSSPYINIQ